MHSPSAIAALVDAGYAPPSALATLTDEQRRFLDLHQHTLIVRWQWVLGGGTLRAWAETGETASITASALAELEQWGIVERIGCAGIRCR